MTITYMDIGGGGATLGAIAAGLNPIWGIEKDKKIATVAYLNCGKHAVYVKDIRDLPDVFWENQQHPDWLHASPPCVNASLANNGTETQEDMELAEAICRAVSILKPKYFSLENVAGYKNFKCFLFIEKRLLEMGYAYDHKVFDCSEYGVPQSRKRLFLVASERNFRSTFFFWERLKKQEPIGWYEAIADLIPTLEPTKLTASQSQALVNNHKVLTNSTETDTLFRQIPDLVIQRSGARKKDGIYANTIRLSDEPMFTIKSMSGNVRPSVQQATIVVNGQPLQPDIRCYARWQTFPDSYQWPTDFKLAMKICGNAVSPLMMKQNIEAVIHA